MNAAGYRPGKTPKADAEANIAIAYRGCLNEDGIPFTKPVVLATGEALTWDEAFDFFGRGSPMAALLAWHRERLRLLATRHFVHAFVHWCRDEAPLSRAQLARALDTMWQCA